MRLKKLGKSTCFALGLAGALVAFLGGVLMVAGFGKAQYTHMASFVLTGAMILFLGASEKGPENKKLRIKLLLLFFALLVAYLRLPPLDLLEILVLPMLAGLYRQKGDGGLIALLTVCEVFYAAARTLALTPLLGPEQQALRIIGGVLVFTAMARFAILWRLRGRAKIQGGAEPVHRLR